MNHTQAKIGQQPIQTRFFFTPMPAKGKIGTSRVAADSLSRDWLGRSHRKIFDAIQDAGTEGRTADELEVQLGMRTCTLTARINELLKSGAISRSGEKRPTRSGRPAHVLVVTPFPSEGGTGR